MTSSDAKLAGRLARRNRTLVAPIAIAVGLAAALWVASGPAHASAGARPVAATSVPRLSWSKAVRLEKAPFVFGLNMVSISCPSAHFCAASDAIGNVVTSSNPAGGSAAWSGATPVATNFYFRPLVLSCPAAGFCAARFQRTIYTSTSPGSGHPVWRRSFIAPQTIGTMVCPSLKLCVAVVAVPGSSRTLTVPRNYRI